jgi:hypothetical protein
MLNVYKVMSSNITTAISANGEVVTKQPLIKGMRVVKKETLKLISDWISRTSDHAMVTKKSLVKSDALISDAVCLIFFFSIIGFGKFHTSSSRRRSS